MSNTHRSALGKMIDMAAIRTKNELTRAVGNMNTNARGDIIDSHGNIINDNNKRVNEHYMRSVMNRGPARQVLVPQDKKTEQAPQPQQAMPVADVAPVAAPAPVPQAPLFTAEELEFDQEDQLVELPVKEEPPVEKREAPKKISLSKKVD